MHPFFIGMRKKHKYLTHGAMMAALYVVLTYLQNALIPDSATWAIQFRASEALCVLALYTPATIWGLSLGCLLFNISYAGALPLDFLIGTLATAIACTGVYLLRNVRVKKFPLLSLLMPGIANGLFVGWELWLFIGGSLSLTMFTVALGEWLVMLTLGAVLSRALESRGLAHRLFA